MKPIHLLSLTVLALLFTAGCDRGGGKQQAKGGGADSDGTSYVNPGEASIELLFPYGSEKKAWISDVTQSFNQSRQKTAAGKIIQVKAVPMGSGESKDEILAGTIKAHLWSPASGVFVTLGNAESQAKGSLLVGPTQDLVLSPVVIAMWKPMAEALGYPSKSLGWKDVLDLATNEKDWAAHGRPEWGAFRFGHTHPEYSNSGVISVLAEAYAASGKVRDLSTSDLRDPKVGKFLADIESSVVHYGKSTGFFGERLADGGPGYLSAAVLYENLVIEANNKSVTPPVVAIYPREGTFWSDHPIGVVQREWVTDEHKEAARIYVDYLRARPQQEKAVAHGFRPADANVPMGAPLDASHGVDPRQPQTTLEVPSADVIHAAIDLWRANKKHSDVVLVFDKSGSMKDEQKIVHARDGARELVNLLGDEDTLTLVPFSSDVRVLGIVPMSTGRQEALRRIDGLFPDGSTLLYDATARAYDHLIANRRKGRISAIVVLTDGEDTGKSMTLDQLLAKVRSQGDAEGVRVFTIGYGKGAQFDVLRRISKETRAEFYEGKPENIRSVFRDIATFF